jgi:hypothetical protein
MQPAGRHAAPDQYLSPASELLEFSEAEPPESRTSTANPDTGRWTYVARICSPVAPWQVCAAHGRLLHAAGDVVGRQHLALGHLAAGLVGLEVRFESLYVVE